VAALQAELARQRERFVATAVEDLGFAIRDCEREFDLTLERITALAGAEPLLRGRAPLCEGPADEVALILPYDGSTWLNIAILSILLAGNRVRVKFSSKGSAIARFTEALYRPLFGDEVSFDYRDGPAFMHWALDHPRVPAIVIFGSDRHILPYRGAVAESRKKLVFEGPGNDPFIVFDDADMAAALDDLVDAKYRYSGQTCTAPERILVQADAYERFLADFAERTRALRTGDPTDRRTDITPLASELAARSIEVQLADALARGGRILCGGRVKESFVEPTVVGEAIPAMRGMQEEIFGPVSYVARFESLEDALAIARGNRYGLRASVWGGPQAEEAAGELKGADYLEVVPALTFGRFGTVSLNQPRRESWRLALITMPIGGYGYSGWVWEAGTGDLVLKQGPKLLSVETSMG
jgi:acyl-CoA reductase-like NAD-dependent aldehyde dehydrogenase